MSINVIVSYDDTANDRDAVALGRAFAGTGADMTVAYVRHTQLEDSRESLEEREAQELLARGAEAVGAGTKTAVIVHASTGEGLAEFADRENADIVVFGSEYRTAQGSVIPGNSARRLLSGGGAAVAIATADLRGREYQIRRIGVLAEAGDDAAEQTAHSLASATGAVVAEAGTGPVDLLIVGSRAGTQEGRVLLSATADYAIETAGCPVLAVPAGAPVRFGAATPAIA